MHTIDIYLKALMMMMMPVKDLLQKINKYSERTIEDSFFFFFCSPLFVIDIYIYI